MASPVAAARGCWTCRLRRKKCSGEQPVCSACARLDISCYGYRTKPSWMDGGTQENERLDEIRKRVKLTTDGQRRQRALQAFRKERSASKISQNEQEHQIEDTSSPGHRNYAALLGSDHRPSEHIRNTPREPVALDPEIEPFLLMYYLDIVFPLQFPFYKPSLSDGGRGWVLSLMMQAKPLYNAALCLAAYHRNLALSGSKTMPPSECTEQDHFYSLALKGLRQHISTLENKGRREGLKDGIEILACVIQLIMFEVARGGTENWYNHLMAAPKIFPFLRTYCTHTVVLDASEKPKSSLPRLSLADHAAVEFFNGVIIWLDILGSASTGLRPQYADICSDGLGDNSKLQLRNIMGCENWTMVLIREIAVLWDWKHEMSERGILSVLELARRGDSIQQRLDAGINKFDAERDQYSDYPGQSNQIQSSEDKWRNNYVISQVTYAYACAAKVYLNVVLSGANPNIPEIAHSVSMAAAALTTLSNLQVIQRLVWPFCVSGCMARGNQRQVFRDLASKAFMGGGNIGSMWKAFVVIQTCWEMHDDIGNAGRNADWLDAMKCLGWYVLLV